MSPFDSPLQNWLLSYEYVFILEVLNQSLNLKFHQMDFLFGFLNIYMNEKEIILHDFHGFKWQNMNIYLI
jgi:hypothetical protein